MAWIWSEITTEFFLVRNCNKILNRGDPTECVCAKGVASWRTSGIWGSNRESKLTLISGQYLCGCVQVTVGEVKQRHWRLRHEQNSLNLHLKSQSNPSSAADEEDFFPHQSRSCFFAFLAQIWDQIQVPKHTKSNRKIPWHNKYTERSLWVFTNTLLASLNSYLFCRLKPKPAAMPCSIPA